MPPACVFSLQRPGGREALRVSLQVQLGTGARGLSLLPARSAPELRAVGSPEASLTLGSGGRVQEKQPPSHPICATSVLADTVEAALKLTAASPQSGDAEGGRPDGRSSVTRKPDQSENQTHFVFMQKY